MLYLITYDLNKSDKDYNGLTKVLEGFPRHNHCQKSVWLIGTGESADQIANTLHPHIDSNDLLLVVRWGMEFQGRMTKEVWDWITANNY